MVTKNMRKSSMMRMFGQLIALFMILNLALPISEIHGSVLLEETFDAAEPGDYPGVLVDTKNGKGWRTGRTGSDVEIKGVYLMYDTFDLVNPDAGTIEMVLVRDNLTSTETLFSFNDVDGQQVMTAYMFWDGFSQKEFPELKFEGLHSERVWYTDQSHPRKGPAPVLVESVPLGREVLPGQQIRLSFTWGPEAKDCKIFLGQTPLNLQVDIPFGMASIVETSSILAVGAEPVKGKAGAYDHINSVIDSFRVLDEAVSSSVPSIQSVTHDTFSVAGYSGRLVVGDISTVTLKAEPGGTATFDFGPVKNHEMSESTDRPGVYTGTHTVLYGEDVEDGQVVGHFANAYGVQAEPVPARRLVTVDTKTYMDVKTNNDLLPADEDSRAGFTIVAKDANGKSVRDHQLKLTLSTTDEYTGTVGGGSFEDLVGGLIEVDWKGVTDSFGEVTAQYISGFAAKTILISSKDMVTGDVGVGWVRSYIDGAVDIVVTEPRASALSVAGSMNVSLSRDWLTADGKSRSRLTAVVKDVSGKSLSGHSVQFTLLGENGSIRVIQGKTDARGRAIADYIAGKVMGQVQVEVRDLTSGMVALVPIELRPDAPAEIVLAADPGEVVTGGQSTVTAKVTDANGNPNTSVDVLFDVSTGGGFVSSPSVGTGNDGVATVSFNAGKVAGLATVKGTVISRIPTDEEQSAARGAVFLYGLDEDPGQLEVVEWLVESGDEVRKGQKLVTLEDRSDKSYTIAAPRDGIISTFVAEERDRVEYGDTLGYIIEVAE